MRLFEGVRRTKSAFEVTLFAAFFAFLSAVALGGEQTKGLQLNCSPFSSPLWEWRWVCEPSWRTKEVFFAFLFATLLIFVVRVERLRRTNQD